MTEEKKSYRIEGRDSTIFRVVKSKDNPYVMIDHRPLTNPDLSFKAKGILSYLLTRPDGWEVNVPDLVNHSTDGPSAIRSGLKELRKAKHIRYNPTREGGYIKKWVIEVYEVPADFQDLFNELENKAEQDLDSDFLQVENLNEGNLQIENRVQLNKGIKDNKELRNKNISGQKKPARASDKMPDKFPAGVDDLAAAFIRETGLVCETKPDYIMWVYGNSKSGAKGFDFMKKHGIIADDLVIAIGNCKKNKLTIKNPNSIYPMAHEAMMKRIGNISETSSDDIDPDFVKRLNGG